jgi:Uma2 family endonuclease
MSAIAKSKMSAAEFLAWADTQKGRRELDDGVAVGMSPERLAHLQAKGAAYRSLRTAIERAGARCEALPDGASVRIAEGTVFEPDAVVYCGPRLPPDAIEIPKPIVIVEALSPNTAAHDHGTKLTGYFSLPGAMHYLTVDTDRRVVIHHRRGSGEIIETRVLSEGVLRLDPPGIETSVVEMLTPQGHRDRRAP